MKLLFIILIFVVAAGFCPEAVAQRSKTIILIRHAEKDTQVAADAADPALSPAGAARAERLRKIVRRYRPGAVYSTDLRRTKMTAEPIARGRGIDIKTYDAKDQRALANEVLGSRIKRFVIVGHSNTIPQLANIFIGKELFKQLDESEYGTIWVIRLKAAKQPRVEVLGY